MKNDMTTTSEKNSTGSYLNNVPMTSWAEDEIPTEKMLMKGSISLSDAELLSIIIGSGIAGENSLDIARTMLSRCGNSLNEFWKCSVSDLQKIKGVGQKQALRISAMFAISRRRNEAEIIRKDKISTSRDAFQIFQSVIGDLPYEEFWVLLLNQANKVLKKVRISEGGISGTVVDPKKLFHICIENHATSIVLGHNHPSGNLTASEPDRKITEKIVNAGKMLDISILDHLIVSDTGYYSFADNGEI